MNTKNNFPDSETAGGRARKLGLTCYILAKNEQVNIGRCLKALKDAAVPAIVLDSYSTDGTAEIARELGANVEGYKYTTHAEALNWICTSRTGADELVMVLDADMVVSAELVSECGQILARGDADVVTAPVQMYWNGRLLRWGSLYPPKAFVFRGGKRYFEGVGHGERLLAGVRVKHARSYLIHNDEKSFGAYLESQFRYSRNLVERAGHNRVKLRDRLRRTPLMMFAAPLMSYLVRGGILCGKTGLGYALDRLIAEAIMFRQLLAQTSDKLTYRCETSAQDIEDKTSDGACK